MVPVKKENYGEFYAGDCYIILYTYLYKNKDEYIIYFWQGQQSTVDEVKIIVLISNVKTFKI